MYSLDSGQGRDHVEEIVAGRDVRHAEVEREEHLLHCLGAIYIDLGYWAISGSIDPEGVPAWWGINSSMFRPAANCGTRRSNAKSTWLNPEDNSIEKILDPNIFSTN